MAPVAANGVSGDEPDVALYDFLASLRIRHLDCLLLQVDEGVPVLDAQQGQSVFFTLRHPDSQPGAYFYKSDHRQLDFGYRRRALLARWDRLPLFGSALTEPSRSLAAFTVAFYRGPGRTVRAAAAPWVELAIRLGSDGLTWPAQHEDDVAAVLAASRGPGPNLALRLKGVTFLSGWPLACPVSGLLDRRRSEPVASYDLACMRQLLSTTLRSVDLEAERVALRRCLADAERPLAVRRRAEEMRALVRLRRDQLARQGVLLAEWRLRLRLLRSETGQLAESLAELSKSAETTADSVRDTCSNLRVAHLELEQARGQLAAQRRFWFAELADIFRLGDESIAGVPLPMSKQLEERLSSADEAKYAAAFGMTAQLTQLVASVMDCPLRHNLICCGSKSRVRDDVILNFAEREFPLYSRGKERSYFLRAVFLLNLNIYGLWCNAGLNTRRPPNLRATAQNLRELLGYLSGRPSDNVLLPFETDRSVCPLGFQIDRPVLSALAAAAAATAVSSGQASDSEAVPDSSEGGGGLPRLSTSPSLSVRSA